MVGATAIDSLTALGATSDEARCYVTLIERGRLSARELSQASGVSRGRIYGVLSGLVAKGIVLEIGGTIRSYEAVAPEPAIDNLVERKRKELSDLDRRANETAALLDTLRGEIPRSPNFVEEIHHRATIQRRFADLQDGVEEEILVFVRPPFVTGHDANEAGLRLLARGVKDRAIYESSILDDPDELLNIRRFAEAGERSRHIPSLPTKLAIFDRRVAMLPLDEPSESGNLTVLIINHAGFSKLITAAFDYIWQQAEELPQEVTARESMSPT